MFDPYHTVNIVFAEVRIFFDTLAEYIIYAIVLFSFCRFKLENALKSFIFVGISFAFTIILESCGEAFLRVDSKAFTIPSFATFVYSFSLSLTLSIITRLLPCIVLAVLAYNMTKNKATKPQKFISFKNEITRVIAIFSLGIFVLNLGSELITDAFYISSFTEKAFFQRYGSWFLYILSVTPNYLVNVFYYLVLIYCVLFFGYKLFDEVTENNI